MTSPSYQALCHEGQPDSWSSHEEQHARSSPMDGGACSSTQPEEQIPAELDWKVRLFCGLTKPTLQENLRDFATGIGFKWLVAFTLLDIVTIVPPFTKWPPRENDLWNLASDVAAILTAVFLKNKIMDLTHDTHYTASIQSVRDCWIISSVALVMNIWVCGIQVYALFIGPQSENWDDLNPQLRYATRLDILVSGYWTLYFVQTLYMLWLLRSDLVRNQEAGTEV